MLKIVASIYVISVILYVLFNWLKRSKPYKPVLVAIGFISLAIIILSLIVQIF